MMSVVTDKSDLYSKTLKLESMEALVAFCLNTGSLTDLLSAIDVLIGSTLENISGLQVVPLLHQLANWQVDLPLSPLSEQFLSGMIEHTNESFTVKNLYFFRKLEHFMERIGY
jgi:hypothetical protein